MGAMTPRPVFCALSGLIAAAALCGCASDSGGRDMDRHAAMDPPNVQFQDIGYATWTDYEPAYRIYPGDELEVTVPSAPELNKSVVVQPDGRVSLPLVHEVMVADRTATEAEATLNRAYASQLLRPEVYVAVKTAPSLKVFVGGEVDRPGVYDMPGDINALQAIIQAGGFKNSAKKSEVIIIRRGPEGRPMMRTADLGKGLSDPGRTDLVPLRRFDIVYVPKTGLASAGVFMKQIEDLVPGNVDFTYAVTNSAKVF